MDDVRKYKLELESKDDEYTHCRIGELHQIYFDKDRQECTTKFNGAVALIRNAEYKGYCNLCMVYHSIGSEEFSNGYTIQIAPLYNEFGQMILLEYDRDDSYCAVECGQKDYNTGQYSDCTLTLWNHGTFHEF